MRALSLVALAGCGRFAFDPHAGGDGAIDVTPHDAGIPGLVVWFRFEDASTTTFVDSMGGPVGTCVAPNCPQHVAGKHGQGLQFDGIDDCVFVPDTLGHFSSPKLTIALWAWQSTLTMTANNWSQISKRVDVAGNVLNSWQIEDYADGSIAFTSQGGGGPPNDQAYSLPGKITVGGFQHLAITWDGGTKRLYVDGVLAAADAPGSIIYDTHDVKIGCDDNTGIGEPYAGTLDEVQVYDHDLTEAEIGMLAQ